MNFLFYILALLNFRSFVSNEVPYAALETAISSHDATKITSFGKERVLVKVLEKESVYSQAQATLVLKDFFAKKPCTSFKFTVKGVQENTASAIGTYVSQSESFRVFVKWTKTTSGFKVESLSIEKA